jgi:hypothetical protein
MEVCIHTKNTSVNTHPKNLDNKKIKKLEMCTPWFHLFNFYSEEFNFEQTI